MQGDLKQTLQAAGILPEVARRLRDELGCTLRENIKVSALLSLSRCAEGKASTRRGLPLGGGQAAARRAGLHVAGQHSGTESEGKLPGP